MIIAILIIILSAICYRIRGSEFYANGFGSRPVKLAIGAFPRALGVLLFAPWPYALGAWFLCALADSSGHAQGQSYGSANDNDPQQALKLTEAGLLSAVPVLAALFFAWAFAGAAVPLLAPILTLTGGALQPAAYWLGWHTPSLGKAGDPWFRRLLTGTEWAEFYTGLLLCLFVLAA